MALKFPDTAVPMGDFPAAMAEHIDFSDGKSLQEKYDLGELGGEGGGHVELTQAGYDALSEEEKLNGVTYFITDAPGGGGVGIDDNNISAETTWSSAKIVSEMSDNYAIFEGVIGDSYYSTVISEEDIANIPVTDLYGGWSLNKVTTNLTEGSILSAYNNATKKKTISLTEDVKIVEVYDDSFSVMDDTMDKGGEPYKVAFLWSNNDDGGGSETLYTSLDQLGLTAPTTVGEAFVAMPDKSMLMLNVENVADANVTITDAPHHYGLLTIEKHSNARFRIEFSNSLGGNASDARKWIGSIKGNDGTGLRWIELTGSAKIYTTMAQLGLEGATATVQDVINKIAIGEIAMLRTDAFNNDNWKTQCNNIQYGYLKIEKTQNALSNIELQEVVAPNRRYFGTQASGKFASWVQMNKVDGTEITQSVIDTYGTEILKYPIGKWRISNINLGNQLTDLPRTSTGAIITIESIYPTKSPWTDNWSYRQYKFESSMEDWVYIRTLNSGDTAGVIQRDSGWKKMIVEKSSTDPYSCSGYTVLTGTEDLFTLSCGHYVSANINTTYNYPITDTNNTTAHIYVVGHLNDPANNKGYRIILYFDNKGRMYRINEWWGSFSNGWKEIATAGEDEYFNGELVYTTEIDLSKSDFQYKGTGIGYVNLGIFNSARIISIEGWYTPPSGTSYSNTMINSASSEVGRIVHKDGDWKISVAGSSSQSGSGYLRIRHLY